VSVVESCCWFSVFVGVVSTARHCLLFSPLSHPPLPKQQVEPPHYLTCPASRLVWTLAAQTLDRLQAALCRLCIVALLHSSGEYLLLAKKLCSAVIGVGRIGKLCPSRRHTSRVVPSRTPDSGDLPKNRHNFSLGTPIEVIFFQNFRTKNYTYNSTLLAFLWFSELQKKSGNGSFQAPKLLHGFQQTCLFFCRPHPTSV